MRWVQAGNLPDTATILCKRKENGACGKKRNVRKSVRPEIHAASFSFEVGGNKFPHPGDCGQKAKVTFFSPCENAEISNEKERPQE
jgi:hypothetical protein